MHQLARAPLVGHLSSSQAQMHRCLEEAPGGDGRRQCRHPTRMLEIMLRCVTGVYGSGGRVAVKWGLWLHPDAFTYGGLAHPGSHHMGRINI